MARGVVVFREEKCKGCELCVSACPLKILQLHETRINLSGYHPAIQTNPAKCTGCANCGLICPDGAITVLLSETEEQVKKSGEQHA